MIHHARRYAVALLAVSAMTLASCSSGTSTSSAPSSSGVGSTGGKGSASKGDVQPDVAGAPAAVSQLSGPITIGLDFRPETDGFGFPNYGKANVTNLTAEELQRYFGDAVCATKANGTCTLTPPAQQWLDAANDSMNGGHCEGMAALALLIKKGNSKAADFGAGTTSALNAQGNDKLTREIAYWFTTQYLSPTSAAELKNLKPSDVVAKLRASFQPNADDSFTLGIYKAIDGKKKDGHAITPYGLVDLPDGKVEIAVYDNNFPGQARAVVVDIANEKWSYASTTNPAEPLGLYEGDATTGSLTITPTSARVSPQSCPFCGGADSGAASGGRGATASGGDAGGSTSGAGFGYLFLNDAGDTAGVDLRVTDVDGQPLAGLQEVQVKGDDGSLAQDDAPPAILVPLGKPFKVTIDGANVTDQASTSVTYVGGDVDLYIDDITVSRGQTDQAVFDPAKGSITYTTDANEAPTIGAGFSSSAADYSFAIGGVDLPSGGSVESALDVTNGTYKITNKADAEGSYALGMSRFDDSGEQTFSDSGFALPSKASVSIDFNDWTAKGDKLKVTVDAGDGSAPAQVELESDK